MKTPRLVPCPSCGQLTAWSPENRWRPFCSERCKTQDLGAWASEQYRMRAMEDSGETAGQPES
ncbi:MAG: DNA gyrase inhibitor YacG [Burkholderiales bacterium]|nr:MAG: DNA gyrase inhibitor YacG [Burkholderiales bacterium]